MAFAQLLATSVRCIRHGYPWRPASTTHRSNTENRHFNCHDGETEDGDSQVIPSLIELRIDCNVRMVGWDRISVSLVVEDGLMVGVVFTQPDMLLLSRIQEEDFEVKVGSALILLEYRVQQSPKTQLQAPQTYLLMCRKYLRVSEMLVIDTMLHLRSELPIQCRPPVARSQIINRENMSGESLRETTQQPTAIATHNITQDPASAPPGSQHPILSALGQASQSSQLIRTVWSPNAQRPSTNVSFHPPTSQPYHTQNEFLFRQQATPQFHKASHFGYNSATSENLLPLSSLSSKNHLDNFGTLVKFISLT